MRAKFVQEGEREKEKRKLGVLLSPFDSLVDIIDPAKRKNVHTFCN